MDISNDSCQSMLGSDNIRNVSWHLNENTDKQKSKEALQSQSPIAAFKACNMIQALGIAHSKIVLPSGDSKAESRGRTHTAPRLFLSMDIADSMSTVMCGAMISLTPCIAPTTDRECDLGEFLEFDSAADVIQKLNDILAKAEGFPSIPVPRKDCHTLWMSSKQRFQQYVMCPEQDCECLVYMSDQNSSMVDAIGIGDHPWWRQRVEDFYGWYTKSNKSVKTSQDAWTWDEGSTSKWSTTSTKSSSKRSQSVPVDPTKRPNPEEQALPWSDSGPMDTSHEFLYPDDPANPCPVVKADQLSPEQQVVYIQWILHVLKILTRLLRILESTVPTVT